MKGIEHLRELRGRYANSTIVHLDRCLVPSRAASHDDSLAGRRVLHRVMNEIAQRAARLRKFNAPMPASQQG
jgi:hypothetical protein